MRALQPLLVTILLLAPAWATADDFGLDYRVGFLPAEGVAEVSIEVTPRGGRVIELDFRMDPERYSAVEGDGEVQRDGDRLVWTPPESGGTLSYRYLIDNRRRGGGYDARMTDDWVIVRGDDLVPSARTRISKGADARTRLRFDLPPGWTNVDTPYLRSRDGESFVIANPERRFDRPVGWIIAGGVGTRREDIEGMEVSIAAPKGDDMRRNEMLAFINILAPELKHALGKLPLKILILGADDPMWRGGLSGPRSLYLHADRPIISENGTSTLVHELVHVIGRVTSANDRDDWITEGLAEFYSVELMRRTGLLSEMRAGKAFEWLANHGRKVTTLHAKRSHGPRTARAVALFHQLDQEIQARSNGEYDIDDVSLRLVDERRVSLRFLREVVEELTGAPSEVLQSSVLDD